MPFWWDFESDLVDDRSDAPRLRPRRRWRLFGRRRPTADLEQLIRALPPGWDGGPEARWGAAPRAASSTVEEVAS